jgi:hypothetical protein
MTPRRLVVRSQRNWRVARRARPVVLLKWRFDDGVKCRPHSSQSNGPARTKFLWESDMTPHRLVVRSQRDWRVARQARPVVVLEWRFDDGVECQVAS